MSRRQYVPLLTAVLCLGALSVFAVPYLFADDLAVRVYYTSGVGSGYIVVVLTLLTLAATLLTEQGTTDGPTRDGLLAGLGVAVFFLTGVWTVTVPPDVVMGLSTVAEMQYHRWVLLAFATAIGGLLTWNASAAIVDGRRQAEVSEA